MTAYVKTALFLHVPETDKLIAQMVDNHLGCGIPPVPLEQFLANPDHFLHLSSHVVVASPMDGIKSVISMAASYNFTIGLIPIQGQKDLQVCYDLPGTTRAALETALCDDAQVMDVIRCNNKILLFKATVGRLPLIDAPANIHWVPAVLTACKRIIGIRLLPFEFHTGSGKDIQTAACGCMIVQHHERTLASKLISHDSCLTDGMISMVVTAPLSILDYFQFIFQTIRHRDRGNKIPSTIGYIKSEQITITTIEPFDVYIDGKKSTKTPLHCETFSRAVRINVGAGLRKSGKKTTPSHERIEVENLPAGKELTKAINRRIPLFSYASEQRFRDLFTTLRNDAQIQPTYLVLMVLSTMLAAVGLYMSSSAVVIGAMLLALLMAPIVALAMGLLRKEAKLAVTSIQTIVVGIFIALSAAGLISLLFPHKPITTEMQARLNPSLLDLAVAIVAGIAGAYTKSHREILQSLAGVSIAVALVPPLAVAGIGLGMGDFHFFSQAFLLFSTNLIGITLAAAFTFRVLGYSSAVRNKPGIALVALVLLAITIPLYLSYRNIVATTVLENSWKHERFLINNKYLIVQRADLMQQKGQDLLIVRVLIREPLTRNDLNTLRKRIESDLGSEQKIRVQVLYIP